MNAKRLIPLITAVLLAPATHAMAEASTRQDHSQFLVWAFLGMCALIVIIQLMPVAMLTYGLVKGLLKGKAETAATEVTVHK
jgi:hypothetical protein